PRGLRFAGKGGSGEQSLASLTVGDDGLRMVWTGTLPAPALSGNVATYREVYPGVDLVLAATRTGFEQSWVVRDRQAAARASTGPGAAARSRWIWTRTPRGWTIQRRGIR